MVRSGSRLGARHYAENVALRHLTPLGLCDRAHPRTFVTRGWGFPASHMASCVYSLYHRMPTCSAMRLTLCKFCTILVVPSIVKLMASPMMNTSGTYALEAGTRTLYTWSSANKYTLLPASG